jgi:hypothetical protein
MDGVVDFIVNGGGTIYQVWPQSDALRTELEGMVGSDATWFGNGLVVEHRYITDLVQGLIDQGYTVHCS